MTAITDPKTEAAPPGVSVLSGCSHGCPPKVRPVGHRVAPRAGDLGQAGVCG